ncbi:MAG: hypothetical protein Q8M99_07705 [Methylotenera sp.]|nr:hypothetical protein [Methylotenera sp.]
MSLQDQHLRQALKHAPDKDMQPHDAARAAVLIYANQAVKRHEKTWLNRISNLLSEWLGVSWHIAGVGSAVATVLVVVVFWHELPDDQMRKVATLSEETEISATDSVIEQVPEATSAEKSLNKASSKAIVPAQEFSAKIVGNKTAIDVPHSKEKSESIASPENRGTLASVNQSGQKNSSLAEAIPQLAAPEVIELEMPATVSPVPASIANDKTVVAVASVGAASSAEDSSATTKGELVKEIQTESVASLSAGKENKIVKKSAAKADVLGASVPKVATKPHDHQVLLTRIENEGGKVAANQDIQVGNLQLLKIEIQSVDFDGLHCPKLTGQVTVIDALTGYRMESLGSCAATDSLRKEVEIYNQTMRDWHSNHLR